MRVITLDKRSFDNECLELADEIRQSGEITALIGVRTGGAIVSGIIRDYLRAPFENLKYFEVGASRCGTGAKNSGVSRLILTFLPEAVLNFLRIIESNLVSIRMRLHKDAARSISLDAELAGYLESLASGKICIIDDAIDSGATVKNILDKCYSVNPQLDYVVAVLVVTQKKPLVMPDFYLHSNVLLRFPWSSDFKP